MMRRLWINADDFGLTAEVSRGIVEAIRNGNVTTTTAMMCQPSSQDHVAKFGEQVCGRIGLHLQLTDGKPLSDPLTIPSLADNAGNFIRKGKDLGDVDCREVHQEWRLQLAAIRSLGIEPVHVDSHHDVHWRPQALDAYIEIAREEELPVRGGPQWLVERLRENGVSSAAMTWTFGDRSEISIDGFIEEVRLAMAACPGEGDLEIACHPGFVDDELRTKSALADQREQELKVLCRPDLERRLAEIGFALGRPRE